MLEEPNLERELQCVMIIKAVFAPHQFDEFLEGRPLLFVDEGTDFIDFANDGVERRARINQVRPKKLSLRKKSAELADVKFGDRGGFERAPKDERFCLFAQSRADRWNSLEDDFASARV